jgi:hypothetical protein
MCQNWVHKSFGPERAKMMEGERKLCEASVRAAIYYEYDQIKAWTTAICSTHGINNKCMRPTQNLKESGHL